MTDVDQVIDTADVLQSTVEDGEIRCTLGDSRSDYGYAQDCPVWGVDGFMSRPNDPSDTGAAQAFYINDANELSIIGTRDNRFAEKAATLKPGDRGILTDGEARLFLRKDGTITLFSRTDDEQTETQIEVDGKGGKLKLFCGTSWIEMDKESIILSAGKSSIMIDKDGITLVGKHFAGNCSTGNLGTLNPLAVPLPGPAASLLFGPVGMAGAPSKSWTCVP